MQSLNKYRYEVTLTLIGLILVLETIIPQTLFPNTYVTGFIASSLLLGVAINFRSFTRYHLVFIGVVILTSIYNYEVNEPINTLKGLFTFLINIAPFCISFRDYEHKQKAYKFILYGIIASGIIQATLFSYFLVKHGIYLVYSGYETYLDGISSHRVSSLFYEPTITFCAVYFSLKSMKSDQKTLRSIFYIMIAVGIAAPWFMVSLRVQSLLFLLFIFLYLVLFKATYKIFLILIALMIPIVAMVTISNFELLQYYVGSFLDKLTKTGASQKLSEFTSIINEIKGTRILTGKGLGALYYNPHYKEPALYTHSLFSFLYLKTGLMGIISFALVSKESLLKFKRVKKQNFIILASCSIPIINALFFQPIYKFTTFFIIIILVILEMDLNSQTKDSSL